MCARRGWTRTHGTFGSTWTGWPAKAYWAALSPSPEFVILFIPGEAFLAPALERDPGLLEYALSPQGAHRHSHHAGHDAAHRAVRLAAGGAGR